MRRKLAFSLVAELALLGMIGATAIAENDHMLGLGAPQAHLLGSLNILGVANPQNINLDSAGGSVALVPLAAKTAIYLHRGDDFAVLDRNKTHKRAESQLPDAGIDPFITGDPRPAGMEMDLPLEAS